jgi:hypothetical protein
MTDHFVRAMVVTIQPTATRPGLGYNVTLARTLSFTDHKARE